MTIEEVLASCSRILPPEVGVLACRRRLGLVGYRCGVVYTYTMNRAMEKAQHHCRFFNTPLFSGRTARGRNQTSERTIQEPTENRTGVKATVCRDPVVSSVGMCLGCHRVLEVSRVLS